MRSQSLQSPDFNLSILKMQSSLLKGVNLQVAARDTHEHHIPSQVHSLVDLNTA